MSDLGERLTGQALSELEARVAAVYGEAARELRGTIEAYFEGFAKRDGEMKALIGQTVNGRVWTEQDYAQWRLNQIGRGKRYQALRERIAQRYTRANETAVTYVNDATGGLYALNRNYAAYAIEQVTGDVGFDLWDEQTVRRLLVEQPGLMPCYPPERALRRGIDLAYGRRQITASVTSSILQGKGLKAMADDLQTRMRDMNRDSAIRTARTAVTGAQNAGRMDSYAAAERMGLTLKKRWMATLDGRTRHSHARLDGETVLPGEAFSNGCRFPGDPQGPAHEVYNCRCALVAELPGMGVKDAPRRARNPLTGQNEVVPGQTFEQWAKVKKESGGQSGAKKTAGWKDRHAVVYYEEVRRRAPYADARRIAQAVPDFTIEQIEEIRQHLFIREQPRDGGFKRFDPDYDQAQAWQRLVSGLGIRPSDHVLLRHEYLELTLMREKGYNYEEAHEIANAKYNWFKALCEEE